MVVVLECHLGVLNLLCILQYSSWCNHVMWLIGNSLPCCHGDQVVTGVPLHVTVATWWSCQSGTQPTRIQTCNSRAWTCIWFHNTTDEVYPGVVLHIHTPIVWWRIRQYSSWCNHVMWLIGNSLPCCHGDQVVTGVPLHVTVATWWSCQSGTQPNRIQTCNSRAWTCIWFHNTNTIWILQLCCVKSFYVGQNPSPIVKGIRWSWTKNGGIWNVYI